MSHCNITHPDVDEKYRHFHDEIAALKLRLERSQMRCDSLEHSLSSIFDRVRKQVTVWLDYPDGKRIYLVGVLDEPKQKDEPLI